MKHYIHVLGVFGVCSGAYSVVISMLVKGDGGGCVHGCHGV